MNSRSVSHGQTAALRKTFIARAVRGMALALLLALPLTVFASDAKSFATADDAVDALHAALKADSDSALLTIFGDRYASVAISPDKAANSANRAKAVAAMETYRHLEDDGNDRRILVIGDQAWPFPIPLVRNGDGWHFATAEGINELVNRRIGANERDAIEVLQAYLNAQKEYASVDRNSDGVFEYAQRLGSTPGTRDGLYWPADASKGDEMSPFGPLVAESAAHLNGHKAGDAYRGYHFLILKRQGKSAPGGAYSYVINGHMIAGFAMVAYPAQYGKSGVMTFIVSNSGKVFEKNLGMKSTDIASKMTTFDPGAGWHDVAQ